RVPGTNSLRHPLDGLAVADVAHLDLAADLACDCAQALLAARDEDAAPASPGERAGDRLPDPARGPGDDRDAGQWQMRTGRVADSCLPAASVATAMSTCRPFDAFPFRHVAENRPSVPRRLTATRRPSAKNRTDVTRLFEPATTSSAAVFPMHWLARGASQVTAGPATACSVTVLKAVFGIRSLPIVSRFFASWKSDAVRTRRVLPAGIGGASAGSGKTASPESASYAAAPTSELR